MNEHERMNQEWAWAVERATWLVIFGYVLEAENFRKPLATMKIKTTAQDDNIFTAHKSRYTLMKSDTRKLNKVECSNIRNIVHTILYAIFNTR